ncbi:MAG: hypothetical protein EZS28_006425 [Streblomastix strix]|uniref:Uncharacterized protein n=1 Tax=Streblomastix strix TaxID=222440 RepID=A0A5J4WSC9_9EUKA|nr:MAG: hypothetical protein EZS28_006425 [Streblomastix strix]
MMSEQFQIAAPWAEIAQHVDKASDLSKENFAEIPLFAPEEFCSFDTDLPQFFTPDQLTEMRNNWKMDIIQPDLGHLLRQMHRNAANDEHEYEVKKKEKE